MVAVSDAEAITPEPRFLGHSSFQGTSPQTMQNLAK